MSIFTRHHRLRWVVPAAAVTAVLGAGVVTRSLAASASPLPERSPAQLLVDLQQARLEGLSGTVSHQADLGLPAIPGLGDQAGGANLVSLASGSHTMRIWYAGPDAVRLSIIGTLGENDVVRSGRDLWTWDSRTKEATHRTLASTSAPVGPPEAALPRTPQEAADLALRAVTPSTEVTAEPPVRVAGRSAYELVLRPRDDRSLVGQVRVALDGQHHVPLRVQVFAAGATKPAVETGFTAVNFRRPEASQFRFTPPPGTKVTEVTADKAAPSPDKAAPPADKAAPSPDKAAPPADKAAPSPDKAAPSSDAPPSGVDLGRATVVGEGWTSVVVVPVPAGELTADGASPVATALNALPTVRGPWGSGRLLRGKLFSALLTDDGRLLVGAVDPAALTAAAGDPAARPKAAR